MSKLNLFPTVALPVLLLLSTVCASLAGQPGSVLAYLPDESQLDGWGTLGDPQTAEGDDLFLLINGGAEIYNEYGFSRAVVHSYTRGDKSVNVEVYEMEDAASAYGAYSFKTSRSGEAVNIGTEASFDDYYLNFWKGNVVVTLVGFDSEPETREAILVLAKMVEAKISRTGVRPGIVDLMPPISDDGHEVNPTYVEGNLGLLNRYRFGTADVFGFSSAVVGDYGEYLLFLFPYESDGVAADRFQRSVERLSSTERYVNQSTQPAAFSADDPDQRHLALLLVENHVIAYVGNRENKHGAIENLAERLASRN